MMSQQYNRHKTSHKLCCMGYVLLTALNAYTVGLWVLKGSLEWFTTALKPCCK